MKRSDFCIDKYLYFFYYKQNTPGCEYFSHTGSFLLFLHIIFLFNINYSN